MIHDDGGIITVILSCLSAKIRSKKGRKIKIVKPGIELALAALRCSFRAS